MTGNTDSLVSRPRVRMLSFTEISAALTCQARHDFAYGDQLAGSSLRRRAIAPILSDGRAWGAAVAAWHSHPDGGLEARWVAHAALLASYARDRIEQEDAGVYVDVGEQHAQVDRLGQVLDHYMATAVRLGNLTRLEDDLVSPLPSRSGRRASNRYRFQARIDGFHVDESGREWIVEFKLRDQLTDVEQIERGRQIRWYAWARQRETGRRVVGVIVDERWNEAPRSAKVVNAKRKGEGVDGRTVSHDTAQVTTEEAYVAVCQEFGAEPQPAMLEALRRRVWQQRVPIPFLGSELDEAGRELVSAAELIRDLDSGRRYPIRNAAPQNCRGCRFRRVCAHPEDELFVETEFERRPPKRERHIEKEEVVV